MRQTEAGPVRLDGGLRLSGAPVRGGHVLWTEDGKLHPAEQTIPACGFRFQSFTDLFLSKTELTQPDETVCQISDLHHEVSDSDENGRIEFKLR